MILEIIKLKDLKNNFFIINLGIFIKKLLDSHGPTFTKGDSFFTIFPCIPT